ncbi:MAG TPA: hypothetical protein PKU91_03990, partial [Phycisphaerales bacterium]|nr:hypothetical protein [Phycisphaerales bacterium]
MPTPYDRSLFLCVIAATATSAQTEPLRYSPAGFTLAQPVTQREDQPSATPASRDLVIRVTGEGEPGFKSDLRSTTGDVSVSRVRAGLEVDIPIGERSTVAVSFNNEWSFYDFSEPSGFGSVAPWDDVWERGIRVMFSTQENDRLAWYAGGDVGASGEYGADFGDSLTYGVLGGVRYAFSDSFVAGIGVYGRSRIESDALFLPAIAFLWKISPEWSLSSQNGRSVRLAYALSEAFTLFAEGGYEAREFRLDDEGPAPEGVGRDRRVPVA